VFVVLDEAKVLTMSKGDVDRSDHIVNVLATEGRKFGIGLVLASQVEDHFGRETLANAACRLAMRPMDSKEARRIARTMEVAPETLLGLREVGAGVYRSGAAGQSVPVQLDKAEERALPEDEARKPI
jgi:DNA helicase HerA-like ATPase